MNFVKFASAVNTQWEKMQKGTLFVVDIDTRELEAVYLAAFPEGTNRVYRERTEHDCSCCKSFIRKIGHVVTINEDLSLSTIWDIQVDDQYQVVADTLSEYVKNLAVKCVFFTTEPCVGAKRTFDKGETWNHFYAEVGSRHIKRDGAERNSELSGVVQVGRRSVEEITYNAIDVVLSLIDDNNLYRGDQYVNDVRALKQLKDSYNQAENKHNWLWKEATDANGRFLRIKNTAIGTLLMDLSEGTEVDEAVRKFESVVAPTNYRRPKAIVTQKMIDDAAKVIEKEGIEESLYRRYATETDLNVNDVLFANRGTKKKMIGGVLDGIAPTKKASSTAKPDAMKITVDDFVKKIATASVVEVMKEGRHSGNVVTLVAPVYSDSKPITSWGNNFTWSYKGGVTDSIAERVKNAGGNIDADVRVSLAWSNGDDLDLSCESRGCVLYYAHRSIFNAVLDVDMNAGAATNSKDPVENIFWQNAKTIPRGEYEFYVTQFSKRSADNQGFTLQVNILGETVEFHHADNMRNKDKMRVFSIVCDEKGVRVTRVNKYLKQQGKTNEGEWLTVKTAMFSPNYWENANKNGTQHLFLMLEGCKLDEPAKGFYNEFLSSGMNKHRKVFELLSNRMVVQGDENNQLTGLGFALTKRGSVNVKIDGRPYTLEI